MIYLDNSTVTRPSEKCVSAMLPYLTDRWGAVSSPHDFGQKCTAVVQQSYSTLYHCLGAKESDTVLLTSSGDEGVNHVIKSTYSDITIPTGKNQYVTAKTDEAAALMASSQLETYGTVTRRVEVDSNGQITAEALGDVITPRTALVSLSYANGLTGVIHQMGPISDLCHDRGIRLHIDISHTFGKMLFDLNDYSPDFLTLSGDRIHAPKGVGALYAKGGLALSPLIAGGMEQAGLRSGNLDIAGLVALATAAKEAEECRDLLLTEVARLRYTLEEGLLNAVDDAVVFFQSVDRLPHVTAIAFPGVANEALLYALNSRGLYASIGGGSFQQISLVLAASGIKEPLASSAISLSLSRETTEEEIELAVVIIAEEVMKLKKLSKGLV